MNILTDGLPQSVNVGGVKYPINTDFRTSVLFELLIGDKRVADHEKIKKVMHLYYPQIPSNENEALKQILWFYNCGKERKKKDERNQTARGFRESKALYSFEKDAFMIYAAFQAQYGIDLLKVKNLHWWKFSALFEGLSEDQKICQVMHIRSMSTEGLSRKAIKRVNELKKYYALEDEASVDSRVKLAQRNAKLKEYVRRRMEEVRQRV